MTEFSDEPSDALRRIYSSQSEEWTQRQREEALWEYWSRRMRLGQSVCVSELLSLIATGLYGAGNVIGEMAIRNMIPHRSLAEVSHRLSLATAADIPWGMRMLDGRKLVSDIAAGRRCFTGQDLEDIIQKGMSWCVLELLPLLRPDDQRLVVAAALDGAAFSGKQKSKIKSEWMRIDSDV